MLFTKDHVPFSCPRSYVRRPKCRVEKMNGHCPRVDTMNWSDAESKEGHFTYVIIVNRVSPPIFLICSIKNLSGIVSRTGFHS